jgi:hypothetical protein
MRPAWTLAASERIAAVSAFLALLGVAVLPLAASVECRARLPWPSQHVALMIEGQGASTEEASRSSLESAEPTPGEFDVLAPYVLDDDLPRQTTRLPRQLLRRSRLPSKPQEILRPSPKPLSKKSRARCSTAHTCT